MFHFLPDLLASISLNYQTIGIDVLAKLTSMLAISLPGFAFSPIACHAFPSQSACGHSI